MEQVEQKDASKGFQFFYYNLSYKKKFYRTLWLFPFTPLALFCNWFGLPGIFWFVAVLIVGLTQAVYNYTKWKAGE